MPARQCCEKYGCLALMVVALLTIGPVAPAVGLDRGHRILVDRGLQIGATMFAPETGGLFDASLWADSNFTTIDTLYYGFYYETGKLPQAVPNAPWTTWIHPDALIPPEDTDILPDDYPYAANLVRVKIKDEQDITDPTELSIMQQAVSSFHTKHPDVMVYSSQGGAPPYADVENYMQVVQPDMLMFACYPFKGNLLGGSPTSMFREMESYRRHGLAGNDGTGTTPIPTGVYTQTFNYAPGISWDHVVSESEIRLNQFAAWTFGFKLVDSFIYDNAVHNPSIVPVMFTGDGTDNPTTQFYQVAETNRQSRNLGPALVRLVSSDARMIMGRHEEGIYNLSNELPSGVATWDSSADPYITGITATNLGSKNDGLDGDVIVGYFKPLDPDFTNAGHEDDIYFMITNGLSDATGLAVDCQQLIHIDFDFGASGITGLQRLNRDTGAVELVSLFHEGGSSYSLDLTLDGGTGDLFKFSNGGVFVPEPGTMSLLGISLGILAIWRLRRRRA